MTERNKTGYFLLFTYFLVVLFTNNYSKEFENLNFQKPKYSHTHDSYETVHHKHSFHIGIFHYLGHVYETIISSDFDSDDHFALVYKLIKNDKNNYLNLYWIVDSSLNALIYSSVHVLAKPPPLDWLTPTNFNCPQQALRAPPSVA